MARAPGTLTGVVRVFLVPAASLNNVSGQKCVEPHDLRMSVSLSNILGLIRRSRPKAVVQQKASGALGITLSVVAADHVRLEVTVCMCARLPSLNYCHSAAESSASRLKSAG